MKKYTALWMGKTGDSNSWYHIYPFVRSRYNGKLHVVRYQKPQREIHDSRVVFHTFNSSGRFSEIFNFFKTSIKVLKTKEIDYIISFSLVPWASFAWILAKIFNKPIVIGLIGDDYNKHLHVKKTRGLLGYILRKTDVITITGNQMLDYFRLNKFVNNVFVYPHCLPDEWTNPESLEKTKQTDLITISELSKNKRTIDIIHAVSLLRDKGVFVTLKIIGIGSEEDYLKYEVKTLCLEDRIKFLGYQKDVLTHLLDSRIFIQASIKEGLSLSLIEALGAGLPPITTEDGSEKDVISHGRDCLFYEKKDYIDLSQKIEFALDVNNYEKLVNGVVKTRKKFQIDYAIRQTEKIQEYLIELKLSTTIDKSKTK